MATNAAILKQLESMASYKNESLSRAIPILKQLLGAEFEQSSDKLNLFTSTVTALAAGGDIITNAGAKVYMVHVESPSTATATTTGDVVVRVFNTSTGGIALTTTGYGTCAEAIAVKCTAQKSKTVVLLPRNTEYNSALSYGVVQAAALDTAAAAANAPTVTILYATL
jgi:hypothetical protein